MIKRIAVLSLLLGLLGILIATRVMPRLQAQRKVKQEKAEAERKANEEAKSFSKARLLEGGSFNPLPSEKSPPGQDPAVLVGKSEWRQRYRPFLDQTLGSGARSRIYVYPFLDNTSAGVGLYFTYGWRLVGAAALSHWSNADVAGFATPKEFGIPLVDEKNPDRAITRESWNARALNDPATPGCRFVITGYYESEPSGALRLAIVLLDRETADSAPRVLFEGTRPQRGEFLELAKEQRDAARAMVDNLLQAKLVQPRAPVEPAGIVLDAELGEIAKLLDTNDTWGVMEGIDRALQLAALFPKETAPLQAAAYGMNLLRWSVFHYVSEAQCAIDYGLRAFALSQVAIQIDWVPDMSTINLLYACLPLNLDIHRVSGAYPKNGIPMPRELWAYWDAVRQTRGQSVPPDQMAALPDWMVLRYEARQDLFDGKSPNRPFFRERLNYWKDCDFFTYAFVQSETDGSYYTEMGEDGFITYRRASTAATQATLASELAVLLTALRGRDPGEKLLDTACVLTRLDRNNLKTLAENGDYYGLRRAILGAFAGWDTPEYPEHPAYFLLGKMAKAAAQVYQTDELAHAPSGYSGFEFTRAERALFAQRRDYLGPSIAVAQQNLVYGSLQGTFGLAQIYLNVRGDSSEAHKHLAEAANKYLGGPPEVVKTLLVETEQSYRLFPLDPNIWYRMARVGYYLKQENAGNLYMKAYEKLNPFDRDLALDMGNLYRRYRYHAKAVQYYDKYLKDYPQRYDVGIERAWSLCEMGRGNEAQVRQAFEVPVTTQPGYTNYHTGRLDYLIYWAKDYDAARLAALFYLESKGSETMGPYEYLSQIEQKAGNPEKAVEWIQKINIESYFKEMYAAQAYGVVARDYLKLNRPDLAEPLVAMGARVDSWQAAVICAMAELAEAKGNYKEALAHYKRARERYVQNTDMIKAIGNCLMKMGQKEEAIRYLEPEYYPSAPSQGKMFLAPLLVNLYVQINQPDKARAAVEHLLQSDERSRTKILETLEFYDKIAPEHAKEIRRNLDHMMAGPGI